MEALFIHKFKLEIAEYSRFAHVNTPLDFIILFVHKILGKLKKSVV